MSARIEELKKDLSSELDVALGTTEIDLDSRKATVRSQEAAIGNLVADAMRAATGADVALTNGGGIRGDKTYAAGQPLTRRDILTELPFGNKTVVVELSGAQIRKALENGVSAVEDTGGRFAHISGMRVEADLSKPKGSRVTKVEVAGQPLDEAGTYTLATNDFLLRGGDDYTVFGEGKVVKSDIDGKLMANDVMVYVRENGTRGAAVSGRVAVK
jgi:2',3'-cyclic-nucleotide 2'-phosphodiesterase (5'-nucleotidase family)